MAAVTSILFLRQFHGFTGGHLKMWHYFQYLDDDPRFRPLVALTSDSTLHGNPWAELAASYHVARDFPCDAVVLGGTDWQLLPRRERRKPSRPVVNLVQGIRHAFPLDKRFAYLKYRAIRVCIGPEIAAAISKTGRARGPVITIPAATDLAPEPEAASAQSLDIFVAAAKAPDLGRRISTALAAPGRVVELQTTFIARPAFLERLRSARVAVVLPLRYEGCFLPALEAMAMGAIVVCPDCVGNRSFCVDGVTCFRPSYDADAITRAALQALDRHAGLQLMRQRAFAAVRERGPERERRAVTELFGNIAELWTQACR